MKTLVIILVMTAALLLAATPAHARRGRCATGYGGYAAGYYPYPAYGTSYFAYPAYRVSYRRPPYGYVVPQPPFYFGHPVYGYGYGYYGPWWW